LSIEANANQILDEADQTCDEFISAANELAPGLGLASPKSDESPHSKRTRMEELRSLNLRDANIRSVIWATGYRVDYKWLDLPILDANGAPVQERGVTRCPGVYFLGLHWMHTFKSGLLPYIGQDAEYLAEYMDSKG
jgi:putative flavoprotein involved in K+ transport